MERLKNLNRASLRGSKGADSAVMITEVKDVIKSQLDSMVEIQKHLQDGDKEGAGFSLKTMVGDTDSLVAMSKELKVNNDLHLPASFDESPPRLEDIPNDQLIQFIPSSVVDELVEHTQGNIFTALYL